MLDGEALAADVSATARTIFAAGVDWIQLRDRRLPDADLWRILSDLVRARDAFPRVSDAPERPGEPPGRRVIVNKRVDLALAAGADGVHLGFDALDCDASRALLGTSALVGASLHSVEEVARETSGAPRLDYVHLAPIWSPLSKPATRPALGVEALAAACRTGRAVLAQGGVDARRAREAIEAGAAGVAVTGILQAGRDTRETIRSLRESLDRSGPRAAG